MDLNKLKAPFPQSRISWRAQTVSKDGTKALALAYIDARDVMERLDEVCGSAGWQCKYSHADKKTICEIGILIEAPPGSSFTTMCGPDVVYKHQWVWKADGAGDSDIEAEKGALSDAFKRAAVRWGIGRYLYDLETPWVPCESRDANGKKQFVKFTDDPWKHVRGQKAEQKPAEPPKDVTPERADAWIAKAKDHAKKFTDAAALLSWTKSDGYRNAITTMEADFPEKATDFKDWINELKETLTAKEAA